MWFLPSSAGWISSKIAELRLTHHLQLLDIGGAQTKYTFKKLSTHVLCWLQQKAFEETLIYMSALYEKLC